jgi:hypothetical protein
MENWSSDTKNPYTRADNLFSPAPETGALPGQPTPERPWKNFALNVLSFIFLLLHGFGIIFFVLATAGLFYLGYEGVRTDPGMCILAFFFDLILLVVSLFLIVTFARFLNLFLVRVRSSGKEFEFIEDGFIDYRLAAQAIHKGDVESLTYYHFENQGSWSSDDDIEPSSFVAGIMLMAMCLSKKRRYANKILVQLLPKANIAFRSLAVHSDLVDLEKRTCLVALPESIEKRDATVARFKQIFGDMKDVVIDSSV